MIPIWQDILNKHFNVVGLFDLNAYMRNMPELCKQLALIKKSQFSNNDRIVFTLFDHDFYLNNDGPGWTLYNLQIILDHLDISNFFCLLLTNQPDYNDHTGWVQKNLTNDDFPIRAVTTLLSNTTYDPNCTPREALIDQIDKSYCVLSRQARPHRTFFMAKLMHNNVCDAGLVGYNNIDTDPLDCNNSDITNHNLPFTSLLNIPQKWQRLLLREESNRLILANFRQQYSEYKNFVEQVDLNDKGQSCQLDNPTPVSNGFLYIGLETEIQIPKVFMTRISLRGIVERRPFVLFGCPTILEFLHSRGFKTFGDFWDESYDHVTNLEKRVDGIIDVVKQVSVMDQSQLRTLYKKMQPIVDYNHNFYHTKFVKQETQLLDIALLKNIKGL
jgi:hypothetical protein